MTAQDQLNRSARSHGWANWSEVLLHNAPPHVINLIVEEAMRWEAAEPESKPEPALTWRPGARVRITGNSNSHDFYIGEEVQVVEFDDDEKTWICWNLKNTEWWHVYESDAVVVG